MAVKVIADTGPEPIDLAFAKAYLKVDESIATEDAIIQMCLKTARVFCEKYRGLSFKVKTIEADVPFHNTGFTELPFGPVISVTNVVNPEGLVIVSNAMLGSTWIAEYLKGMSINNTWKEDYWTLGFGQFEALNYLNSFSYKVTYTGGYTADDLPENYKMAILKMTAELYENRENTVVGMTVVASLPLGVKALLDIDRETVLF